VSDVRETFELEAKDGDPSGVRLTTQDADKFCNEPECLPHATTILLDDLLEVFFLRPVTLMGGGFVYDSTSIRRPFDCFSKVIKVTLP